MKTQLKNIKTIDEKVWEYLSKKIKNTKLRREIFNWLMRKWPTPF
jgi:uncharacterized protein YnzC (UPF0291/DUF896 family)